MKQLTAIIAGLVAAFGSLAAGAHAQDAIIVDVPTQSSVTRVQAPEQAPTWEEYRYKRLQASARRSRNALIGTSAATAVGFAMGLGFGAKCTEYVTPVGSDRLCTTRGQEAGLTIGAMMFTGGAVGMLTTGIMLGVRKGKLRRLDDQARVGKSRAVRWDLARSRFVF